MKKVIIMRGLPGSGKSTYAKNLVAQNPNSYKRINRDDLRMMFDNGYTSKGNEKFIKQVRDMLIIKALEDGKHVIVDDTNLSEKNIVRINQLVHDFNKKNNDSVKVEVKDMEVSLEQCIENDSKREGKAKVGEKVIREMYRNFIKDDTRYAVQNEALPKAIICDLDGTLCLMQDRDPYNASTCDKDLPNKPVLGVLKEYAKNGYKILLISAREEQYKPQTLTWLERYGVHFDELLMRKTADTRKDSIIKTEIYNTYIKDKYMIEFVLDDRNQVVYMWRDELRLPCFQVYYGDF